MGVLLAIFIVGFVIPLTFGAVMVRRSRRKLGFSFISIPIIIILAFGGWMIYEANHHFIKNTDLSMEKIDDLKLYDSLNEDVIEQYGYYEMRDNVYYAEKFEFKKRSIGVDDNRKILYLYTEDPKSITAKSISVNHSLDDVKKEYGDRFYIARDMGMEDSLNYVDREAKRHLQFYFRDDVIISIVLQELY